MAEPIASLPGVELYRDGLRYQFKVRGLGQYLSLSPSQEGFAPISHVNAIEIAVVRDLGSLIISVALIPVIIGIPLLLLWMFLPPLVIRFRSDGEVFATIMIPKSHRQQAEQMVLTYRKLKHALNAKSAA